MKAMILAAGLGTRLLPFTLKRPKPLFPILNTPLLGLTVNRIRNSGFSEILVNGHHLRQQIKKAVQHEENCILQEEEKILGTGGGLRMALPHFNHEPVLVVNGDIYIQSIIRRYIAITVNQRLMSLSCCMIIHVSTMWQ